MKYIYLLRHAKSSWTNQLLKDHDRPLSERGIKACHKIETFISQNKIIPEIAYISSSQTTSGNINLNTITSGNYYFLVVDSTFFNSNFNPFSQFFSNSYFLNNVLQK